MPARAFVDCHSHVGPSGDDGARNVGEGVELCRDAVASGTRLLYATPHVWPDLRLHEARERRFREAVAEMATLLEGLELRIGFELTPDRSLLDDDPRRYRLEGTAVCLVETPFSGGLATFFAVAEHVENAGLTPLIAHPERSLSLVGTHGNVDALLERGWPLQLTASSLTGRSGADSEALAWRLLGSCDRVVVASDGHGHHRPARLDVAWNAVRERLGSEIAARAFDGSVLGVALTPAADDTLSASGS